MANIDSILLLESSNKSIIYLYACDEQWCAYEHSAYHFSRIFQTGEIEQQDGVICLRITNQFEFLHSLAMCSIQITSIMDDQMELDCGSAFVGFEEWKKARLICRETTGFM